MRKAFAVLLCISLIVSLYGCKRNKAEIQEPVEFYYCFETVFKTDDGVTGSETREAAHFNGNLEQLLQVYLLGPVSDELTSPLPYAVKLVSLEQVNDSVYLTLSREFSTLSGIRLTTACSCIVMTLHDYAGINQVCFRAASGQLDNKDEFIMSITDIVLSDNTVKKG